MAPTEPEVAEASMGNAEVEPPVNQPAVALRSIRLTEPVLDPGDYYSPPRPRMPDGYRFRGTVNRWVTEHECLVDDTKGEPRFNPGDDGASFETGVLSLLETHT